VHFLNESLQHYWHLILPGSTDLLSFQVNKHTYITEIRNIIYLPQLNNDNVDVEVLTKMQILTFTYLLEVFKFEKQNIGLITTFPETEDVRPERSKAHCSQQKTKYKL